MRLLTLRIAVTLPANMTCTQKIQSTTPLEIDYSLKTVCTNQAENQIEPAEKLLDKLLAVFAMTIDTAKLFKQVRRNTRLQRSKRFNKY